MRPNLLRGEEKSPLPLSATSEKYASILSSHPVPRCPLPSPRPKKDGATVLLRLTVIGLKRPFCFSASTIDFSAASSASAPTVRSLRSKGTVDHIMITFQSLKKRSIFTRFQTLVSLAQHRPDSSALHDAAILISHGVSIELSTSTSGCTV